MTNAADEIAYAGNGIDESDGADTTVDSYLNRKYETGDGTLYADADSKYAVDLKMCIIDRGLSAQIRPAPG